MLAWRRGDVSKLGISLIFRYDDEYYYDDGKFPGGQEAPGQMMPGEEDEEFDSDDALFFDNNDLANRIWEDGD